MEEGRHQKVRRYRVKKCLQGVPWWLSVLRVWHCHCCGSGHCCGESWIPGPGTSSCHRCGQKKKKKSAPSTVVPTYPLSSIPVDA